MPDDIRSEDIRVRNPLGGEVELSAPRHTGALVSIEQQRAVAEVQARMIIARANPREPIRAMDLILQDCTRPSLAASAIYQYARGGTDISGPSIRLAETVARRWGNIAAGIKEISRREGYSECVAYAWDLETGYYDERQFQVRHWRDTKSGGYQIRDERDIYELIANMGQRRKRAVLLSVIPGDVVESAIEQCEATLAGSQDASPEGIQRMIAAFVPFGVTKEQIEVRCQRRAEAIRPAQLVMLRKIYASLKDGMSEPEDWFDAIQSAEDKVAAPRGNEALAQKLGTPQPAPAPAPEAAETARQRHEKGELIAQAQALGLKPDGRWSAEKIKAAIDAEMLDRECSTRSAEGLEQSEGQNTERTEGVDPAGKPPEADNGAVDGAGTASEPEVRPSAGASSVRPGTAPDLRTNPVSHGEAGGSPAHHEPPPPAPRVFEPGSCEVEPLVSRTDRKPMWHPWVVSCFMPTLRQAQEAAEVEAILTDNEQHLDDARAVIDKQTQNELATLIEFKLLEFV